MVKTRHLMAAVIVICGVVILTVGYFSSRPTETVVREVVVTATQAQQTAGATATEEGPRVIVVTATSTPVPQPSAISTAMPTTAPMPSATSGPVNTRVPASPVMAAAALPDKLPHFDSITWDTWLNVTGDNHGNFQSYNASGGVNDAMLNGVPVTQYSVWLNGVRMFNRDLGSFTTPEQQTYWHDVKVCVTNLAVTAGECRNFILPRSVNGGGAPAPTPPTPPAMPPTRVSPGATHTPVP